MKGSLRYFDDRAGASAIEFAILAPVFLLVLLTMVGFGIYLSAATSIQAITADAARTAVAGLNETERTKLAEDYIKQSTLDYYLLSADRFSITVSDDPHNTQQFTVAIDYDASNLPIWSLYSFALPEKRIKRFSTIRIGGV
jgi:Flp pilus assembly protein TadG